MNGNGVAVVGPIKIGDSDALWAPDVERSTMGMRIARRQLTDQLDL